LGEMIYMNMTINSLFLSWNEIKGEGGACIFSRFMENSHIKVLDLSFNPLGSMHFQKVTCIKELSDAFKKNKTLLHLDISYCGFTREDLNIMNTGLKYNHSLLGIHMVGNQGGVDSLGFLNENMEPPSSSQLITKIDANLKAGEVDTKDLDLQK